MSAARVLNSVPSGNAELERHFGKASELWSDPFRSIASSRVVTLRANAHVLRMPGYPSTPVGDALPDDDGEEPTVDVESEGEDHVGQ